MFSPASARSSLAWSSVPLPISIPLSIPTSIPISIPSHKLSVTMVDVAVQTSSVNSASSEPSEPSAQYHPQVDAKQQHYVLHTELPNEIWGEIARFSSQKDVLNLRTVSIDIRKQADTMITALTLTGTQALIDFAYTDGFKHIKTLHLSQMDNNGLSVFATRLASHARANVVIDLTDSHVGVADGLAAISRLPLGELRLNGVYVTSDVVEALAESTFPISLSGYMTREELINVSRIPTLINLAVKSAQFSDDVALSFANHPSLQKLSFSVNQSFSSAGLTVLAAMPDLRALHLYDTVFMANLISTAATRGLAASRTLETLSIETRTDPLSDACLSSLSVSTTLRSLSISLCPGVHHVTRMVSLEHLVLNGRCVGTPRMNTPTAHLVGGMPFLKALTVDMVTFEDGAFRTLIWHLQAEALNLSAICIEEDGVVALLANSLLKKLSLVKVTIAPEHVVALCEHASLDSLTIDGVPCQLANTIA